MPIKLSRAPETIPQLIKRSLKLYRTAFFRVIFLAVILAIIDFSPRIISLVFNREVFEQAGMLTPHKLWLVLIDFLNLLFFTMILWRMHCFIKDNHESLLDDLKRALKKWPRIIGAAIVQSLLMVCVGLAVFGFISLLRAENLLNSAHSGWVMLILWVLILQVILAVYVFFLLYFYIPLILIENKSIFAALKKSAELVWGNWWRTFCVLIAPWVGYLLLTMIIKFVFRINIHIYFVESPAEYTYAGTILHLLIFALFIPWLTSALLVQLRDLELRKKLL